MRCDQETVSARATAPCMHRYVEACRTLKYQFVSRGAALQRLLLPASLYPAGYEPITSIYIELVV